MKIYGRIETSNKTAGDNPYREIIMFYIFEPFEAAWAMFSASQPAEGCSMAARLSDLTCFPLLPKQAMQRSGEAQR